MTLSPLRLDDDRIAYENLIVERLDATHPDTPSDRCAWCGPVAMNVSHDFRH